MIHLTNDAVQKKGDDYGKFENANKVDINFNTFTKNLRLMNFFFFLKKKLSFSDFQKYLDLNYPESKFNFFCDVNPKLKVPKEL